MAKRPLNGAFQTNGTLEQKNATYEKGLFG